MDLCGQNKKWHVSAIFVKSAFPLVYFFCVRSTIAKLV